MEIKNAIHCRKVQTDEAVCEECDLYSGCTHETQADIARISISALEKQIPKKIDFELNLGDYTSRFVCKCGKSIIVKHDSGVMNNNDAPNYCPNCGQKLDWSETKKGSAK